MYEREKSGDRAASSIDLLTRTFQEGHLTRNRYNEQSRNNETSKGIRRQSISVANCEELVITVNWGLTPAPQSPISRSPGPDGQLWRAAANQFFFLGEMHPHVTHRCLRNIRA